MLELGVFFGSRAAEHDVSVISGLQILENADKSKYHAFPVYISRTGEWFVGEPLKDIKTYRNFNPAQKGLSKVTLPAQPGLNGLYALGGGLLCKPRRVAKLDCAILAMHGMHGEDGTLQGLMELADIPYSSCSLVGSAVGMDKIVMKAVFQSMGLPVLPGVYCYRSEWRQTPDAVIERAERVLQYPMFVKPANLGSSIGIGKANDREAFRKVMEVAACYDRRILIERAVEKPVEINCACLGFDGDLLPSLCEQPAGWDEFLSFEDKYTRGGGKGMKSLDRKLPAPISEAMTKQIQGYTADIFRMLECKGVVRVDYILEGNAVYVNEINTIPGSFAFYLYEPMGLPFAKLVDKLVEYAQRALAQKQESSFAFSSDILNKAMSGVKILKK
ncbi:MAG: D-alanine--D-alanine ligase [Christensenellaceae bacterium]|jgi:D-alanine-D-alanine ligase|nr:D-alanine--D-alanine ligase [Christensenellaceae bacterium]